MEYTQVHAHLTKAGAQRAAATLLLGQEVANLDTEGGTFEGCDSCFGRVMRTRELIQSFLDQNYQLSDARKKEILRGIRATGLGGHRIPFYIRHSLESIT